MQKWYGIGNLVRDVETTTSSNGTMICKFSLAIRRDFKNAEGEYESDYFNITAFGKLGENCNKFLKKGSKCCVVGRLQNRSYDAQDGTKRYVTDIIANEVEFLSTSNTGYQPTTNTQENPKRTGPITIEAGSETIQLGLEPIDPDEDLPF